MEGKTRRNQLVKIEGPSSTAAQDRPTTTTTTPERCYYEQMSNTLLRPLSSFYDEKNPGARGVCAISPLGRIIASVGQNHSIKIWNIYSSSESAGDNTQQQQQQQLQQQQQQQQWSAIDALPRKRARGLRSLCCLKSLWQPRLWPLYRLCEDGRRSVV
mmetsp:Transcript_29317/g.40673  ORF Transcript_29317/g.40673 Transcript_29317/m.40673 type:complete len:158 (+) Transcript_29317:127-600(+)